MGGSVPLAPAPGIHRRGLPLPPLQGWRRCAPLRNARVTGPATHRMVLRRPAERRGQVVEANKADVLLRIGLFEGISQSNREALAGICLSRHVKAKETLFVEGRKGMALYVLVSGSVQLYKVGPGGRKVVIKTVKPGELFAEAVLFEKPEYPVSAVALRDSLLYLLPKHQFTCLLENRAFREEFVVGLMQKLRYLADQIAYLTAHDVDDRLMAFLAEQYGEAERVVVKIPKKDIAAAIGTTPETLSRVIQRMRESGQLEWGRGGEVRRKK